MIIMSARSAYLAELREANLLHGHWRLGFTDLLPLFNRVLTVDGIFAIV